MDRRAFLGSAVAPAIAIIPTITAAKETVKIGLSLPVTGGQAEVAEDLLEGYRMAARRAEQLGITLRFEVADDKSDPKLTAKNIGDFSRDPSFAAASGIVGTPHAKAALPAAVSGSLPIVGIRSGAQELRDGSPFVFHLRATFESELTRAMRMIKDAGTTRLAVVYSNDSFGLGSFAHVKQRAAEEGITVASAIAADRDGQDIERRVREALEVNPSPNALLLLMIVRPMMAALKLARERHFFLSPTFAMSFTATREVASAPITYATGLGLVAATPLPRTSTLDLAADYRAIRLRQNLPEQLDQSLTAMEGFFYGSAIAQAVARAQSTARSDLIKAMQAGPTVGGIPLHFNELRVGYQQLQVLVKSATGRFVA